MTIFLKKHIHLYTNSSKVFMVSWIVLLSACSSNLERISAEQINKPEQLFAEQMANLILDRCSSYDYSALPVEHANEAMVNGFDAGVFRQTCEFLKDKYGRFRGLEFVEAMRPPESNEYTIYRFKGNFKEAIKFPEIRITIDQSGKLAGFYTVKWSDNL